MNHPIRITPRPLALAVAVALGTGPLTASAAAGRIQFAWGQVSVEQDGGKTAPLKRGDKVDAGDTIVTDRGRAQIKFTDGSKISLQPETTFKINEYDYDDNDRNSAKQRNFMSLFRGGLRAISGAIGRSNRNAYRLNTPVGTIGIRGTEYLIQLDGSGLIVTVGDGAVALVNDAGEVLLVNGQTGRIVDKNSLPKMVKGKAVVPPPPKDVSDEESTGQPQQDDVDVQVTVTGDDGDREGTGERVGFVPPEEDEEMPMDEMMADVPPPLTEEDEPPPEVVVPKLVSGAGYTIGYSFPLYGGPTADTDKDSNVDATFVDGGLTAWANGSGPSDIGDMTLVESGSDDFIGWGRWSNETGGTGNFTVVGLAEGFDDPGESLHYVAGRPTDLNALYMNGETVANYSVLSFTSPTDDNGNIGTLNQANARFQVDFGPTSTISTELDFTVNSIQYFLDAYGVNASTGEFRSTGAGVFSPSSCSFGCNAAVAGIVTGPVADRAGVVYSVDDNDQGTSISGAVTFFRDPNGAPVNIPQ